MAFDFSECSAQTLDTPNSWDKRSISFAIVRSFRSSTRISRLYLPILTKGGVDINIGQFISYNGFEKLTSKDNIFYTRSYSSNFGPFVDTGIMSILHASDWLDLYVGIVTGVDTWIGWPGDNNNSPSIYGGFGLNLLNGDLSILAVTHSGPENPNVKDPLNVGWPDGVVGGVPAACACNPNTVWRTFNNVTVTWNATENLNFATDISYFRESGWYPISIWDCRPTRSTRSATISASTLLLSPSILEEPTHTGSRNMQHTRSMIRSSLARALNFGATQRISSPPPIQVTSTASILTWFPSAVDDRSAAGTGDELFCNHGRRHFFAKADGSSIFFEPDLQARDWWEAAVNDAAPFFGPSGAKRSQGLFSMDVIAPFTIQ